MEDPLFHKIGASFSIYGKMTVPSGVFNPSGYSIASRINDSNGNKIDDLTASFIDPPTDEEYNFLLSKSSESTALWPSGVARFDVKITNPSEEVDYTQTKEIMILTSETP